MVFPKLGVALAAVQTGGGGKWRNAIETAVRRGQQAWREIFQKGTARKVEKCVPSQPLVTNVGPQPLLRSNWLQSVVRGGSCSTLAGELRRRAVQQLQAGPASLYGRALGLGRSVPLYAFVGLALHNQLPGHNTPSEMDGFDNVCQHIKTMFQPVKVDQSADSWTRSDLGQQVDDFSFGPLIAKGCNAAVYQARLRPTLSPDEEEGEGESIVVIPEEKYSGTSSQSSTLSSDYIMVADDSDLDSDIEVITESDSDCEGTTGSGEGCEEPKAEELGHFDLAVKMMFNYYAESTAYAIMRTMENEVVPAKMADLNGEMDIWQNGNHVKKKRLKPHPNIVDMWGVFVDDVPELSEAHTVYASALPPRLNPDGCGRNKTMFLVMKRYTCTLRDYLRQRTLSMKEATILLTQLVEAVVHLNKEGIAHRDIKSDNILLDLDRDSVQLVLSDFGCCLADEELGLHVPYFSNEVNKGGNGSLMAPEISTAKPGNRSYLDYRKSDLWACGAVAYEIFGGVNPFYRCAEGQRLDSRTYNEQELQSLQNVPEVLQNIVRMMLRRDPSQRPDAIQVANMLQLLLWMPPDWKEAMTSGGHPPCRVKVMRWLLTFSAGVLCQRNNLGPDARSSDSVQQQTLQTTLLARLDLGELMEAIHMLWAL